MYCTTATVIFFFFFFFNSTVSTFDFEGSLYCSTRGPHYLFGGRHRGAPLYILISLTAIKYILLILRSLVYGNKMNKIKQLRRTDKYVVSDTQLYSSLSLLIGPD